MEYLVIDGYNVINQWSDLFDLKKESLEDSRDKLLHMLSNYQGYKRIKVIVVFDAYLQKRGQEKIQAFDNIKVVYTKEGETADNFIERFVYLNGRSNLVKVVTSDFLEQIITMSSGGIRVSPRELRLEIQADQKAADKISFNPPIKNNTIMSKVAPDIFEKLDKIRKGK
ncbi:MAG: NYN domain-containing protein [Ruminiclostridium sp.]